MQDAALAACRWLESTPWGATIRLSSWLEYAISAVAVVATFIGLIRGRRRDGTEPPRPAEARVPVGAAP